MDNFSFGMTMTVVGMGSTLFSLWFLTLIINLLKRIFPYREPDEEKGKEAKS
jgi:Na+-transporting methylmalonyl-CoA/oxaloacetate decarboxylase gamma subunit